MTKLNYETIGAIIHLMRKHRCYCESEVKKFNIHHSQHKILMHIVKCDGKAPTQIEIAQHFHISAAAVAVTLKKLESAGYIARSARSNDMRNNEVVATELGKKLCKETEDAFDAIDQKMFEGFEKSEIIQFKNFIDRMLDNLSKGEKQ